MCLVSVVVVVFIHEGGSQEGSKHDSYIPILTWSEEEDIIWKTQQRGSTHKALSGPMLVMRNQGN